MSQSNRERLEQVSRWLAKEFPTLHPVTLKFPKKIAALPGAGAIERRTGDAGESYRDGRRIIIRIAVRSGLRRSDLIETLIHEWSHAASMRHQSMEDKRRETCGGHDSDWAMMYGRIYQAFVDDSGSEDSKSF